MKKGERICSPLCRVLRDSPITHHHGLEATLSTDRQENAMTRALQEASPYFGGTLRTGQKENAMKGTLGPKSQFQGACQCSHSVA